MGRKLKVGDWVYVTGDGSAIQSVKKVERRSIVVGPHDKSWGCSENREKVHRISDKGVRKLAHKLRIEAAELRAKADAMEKYLVGRRKQEG